MYRVRVLLAAAVVGGLGLVALAADKSEPPKPPGPETTAGINKFITAHELIAYGRKEKSPVALLLAARMLHEANARDGEFKSEDGTVLTSTPVTPKELVAEARKLSDDPHVAALADETDKVLTEAPRDGGARATSYSGDLKGQRIIEHDFRVGRPATVFVFCPRGQQVTVKVMNTETTPPTVVGEQTGANVRIDWTPAGSARTSPHKIFITPQSPVPFYITWATS